jgi:F5/8 type C domain/Fibronectin type III domain
MRSRKAFGYALMAVAVVASGAVVMPASAAEVKADLTDDGGTITSQYPGDSEAEGLGKLIDNDDSTKYYTGHANGWVQYEAKAPTAVDRYSLTSANDAPDRDPRDWKFAGSADGSTWTTLDTRVGETFDARARSRGFMVAGKPAAYRFYRLTVTANGGSTGLQMAEWRLWPVGDGIPAAPSGAAAAALSADQVDVIWRDNSSADVGGYPETGFAIESSANGSNFQTIAIAPADTTAYTDHTPLDSGTRFYRVRAVGANGVASEPTAAVTVTAPTTSVDITDMNGTVTDQYATTGGEDADKSADNAIGTKYYTGHSTTWLKHTAQVRSVVTSYTLTSANDAPNRDPRDWALEGSNDDTAWTTLDTRSGASFSGRFQRGSYSFANTVGFRSYRLRITANNGAPQTQLGEWQLIGTKTTSAPDPAAPTGLAVTARTGDQVVLTWNDVDRWATSFRVERSTDGLNWDYTRSVSAGTTTMYDLGLTGSTTYQYRVRAVNGSGASAASGTASVTTGSGDLPATWQEHWLEHNQLLTRVSYNGDLAVYFDGDVDPAHAEWLTNFVGPLWSYTKQTYGSFSNPRLAAIFHQGRYGGGHPADVFGGDHDYRNVIDIGYSNWVETDNQARDLTSHEIAHIVEGSSQGVHKSPAFGLWGDSKWAEIFQFDAYVGTGMTADADRFYAAKMKTRDSYPRANTAWFKDWFYPIWSDHGHSAVLAKFFTLMAANYTQVNGEYARDMNMGEFVHFWSGAAGTNLKALATQAFGWSDEWEAQFIHAQQEFPGVRY